MKGNLLLPLQHVRKGSLMVLSYFVLAACMQHEENLAPKVPQSNLLTAHSEVDGVAAMNKRTFTAHLNAANEVNEDGVESDAQGQAIFTLNADGTELHYKLIVANIKNITMAHIHCGEAGVNGPFIAWLFERVADPGVSVNGILEEGVIASEDVVKRTCAGGAVSTFEDLMHKIRTGAAYVNVHTTSYPGGEIRGQIK